MASYLKSNYKIYISHKIVDLIILFFFSLDGYLNYLVYCKFSTIDNQLYI
jgi:hypothetical protein